MITLLSGTNRPGSVTRKLTRYLEGVYAGLGHTPGVVDLLELPAEGYSPAMYERKPDALKPFIDAMLECKGLVILTPEYNGSFPGALKYFIDMLPHPKAFQRKPVALIGLAAGEWGALRPVEHLQGILSYRGAYQFPERVFVKSVGKQLDPEGRPVEAELQKRFADQAAGFLEFVGRF